ncbi:MAG: TIGR00159 family protein [Deltaproteobacteria bacterium]|nr:TIGR00159 family protein [Deltaproteobacteria bacterium]
MPEEGLIQYLLGTLDVLVVAYLIYRILLVMRGTRAAPMLGGLALVVLAYFISKTAGLVTLHWILGNFLSSIILVVIVIFQEEIRRGLTKMGIQPVFRPSSKPNYDRTSEDLVLVAERLSSSRTGALIVIQREVGLDEFVEEAVEIDALLNRKLLVSLFQKDSPLHDGAVIINDGRIKAAGCVLPITFNPDLDPNLGTRHRAALGISERSDALAIVVSEETGAIALARDGKLSRNLDGASLKQILEKLIDAKDSVEESVEEEAL